MVPSGDACSPSGKSRLYSVDLGTGQSRLLNPDGSRAAYLTPVAGVITDLRETSVNANGRATRRLVVGDDQGNVTNPKSDDITPAGIRRLNWRELLLAD